MALLDLGAVTRVLKDLIKQGVESSAAWPMGVTAAVSAAPPDRLGGDTIGLYLFHTLETAESRGRVTPAGAEHHRHTPLGLRLHYLLTVRAAGTEDDIATLAAQRTFGLALKVLHDYPQLNDTTTVAGNPPLLTTHNLQGERNRFTIQVHSVPPKEAMDFWQAGSLPRRLAAHVEVGLVELEPEDATAAALPVLSYHISTLLDGGPWIEASENPVTMVPPGLAPITRAVRPAVVEAGGTWSLVGSGLSSPVDVLIQASDWAVPQIADAAWAPTPTPSGLSLVAQTMVAGQALLPGLHRIAIVVSVLLPAQPGHRLTRRSNTVAWSLAAAVTAVGLPDAARRFTIDGGPFSPAERVEVQLGEQVLVRHTAAGVLPAGRFRVLSAIALEVRASATSHGQVPVVVTVNGVASPQLHWIGLP